MKATVATAIALIATILVVGSIQSTEAAKKVIIVGAGVSGLTAATELALRGYEVVIYERQPIPGGKVKAYWSPDNLPMEHGFHFFPGEYQNLPRTFAQVPFNGSTLYDHLVKPTEVGLAFPGSPLALPARIFASFYDFLEFIKDVIDVANLGITAAEIEFYGARVWSYLSSCDGRRHDQFQNMSYADVIAPGGPQCWSEAYYDLMVDGLSIDLVASKPPLMSADTMLQVLVGLLWGGVGRNDSSDRIFDGPGNIVWTDPWVEYLGTMGVQINYNQLVTGFNWGPGNQTVAGIKFCGTITGQCSQDNSADYYLISIPVERMATLGTQSGLFNIDTGLASILNLEALWMNGVFVYLYNNTDVVHGHVDFVGSPWALTLISNTQFWPDFDWSTAGDGKATGVLSFIISDWFEPGIGPARGKNASDCNATEIFLELSYQVGLAYPWLLTWSNIHSWYIDEDIVFHNPADAGGQGSSVPASSSTTVKVDVPVTGSSSGAPELPSFESVRAKQRTRSGVKVTTDPSSSTLRDVASGKHQGKPPAASWSPDVPMEKRYADSGLGITPITGMMSDLEPLMVNYVYSWWDRPDGPWTTLKNLFISGDYVKTDFQLACAEGANESGKYAVNAILTADKWTGEYVQIYNYTYPTLLQDIQMLDCPRWNHNHSSLPPNWVDPPACQYTPLPPAKKSIYKPHISKRPPYTPVN